MTTAAPLHLRPCVIAGETRPGDYSVFADGELVGRIRQATEHQNQHWVWSITVHMPGAAAHGSALDLEEAKRQFRAAWDARPR